MDFFNLIIFLKIQKLDINLLLKNKSGHIGFIFVRIVILKFSRKMAQNFTKMGISQKLATNFGYLSLDWATNRNFWKQLFEKKYKHQIFLQFWTDVNH